MAEHTGEIRQGWQALYPYESHSMTIGGFRYNYVDEGPTEPDGVDRPTLICVQGLVEIPCIKRNVSGLMIAFSSADMALAGISSRIPVDECIDAMREVGEAWY